MSKIWYNATNKDSLQGLVCDEETGENIAVTYNPEHAAIVAAAPELLAACTHTLHILRIFRDNHPDEWDKIIFPDAATCWDELRAAIQKSKERK